MTYGVEFIGIAILFDRKCMLLIGIFMQCRGNLMLLIRQNLLTLSDVKAFLCFFQKSFGRFFKNDFFNLHLLSGVHYRKGSFRSWIYAPLTDFRPMKGAA